MTSMILFALNAAQLADRTRVASEEQKVQSRWAGGFPVKKVEKEITVLSRRGLDAKLARVIVQVVNWFSSDIWIVKNGTPVDGKSLLGLMVLGAKRGSKLRIRVEGPDAPEAMQEIEQLLSSVDESGDIMEPEGVPTGHKWRRQVARREGF